MAFYQKYRSQKFADLIGQNHVRETLLEAVKSGKTSHAYLLSGPRGTGKTSTARLLAKAMNCLTTINNLKKGEKVSGEPCNKCSSCVEITDGRSVDIVEIDAASHTGVDDIRDLIDKSAYAPSKADKKVYIIDEAHMLSKSAFNALLKTLEEPPKHLVFILATTEAYKLPPTILSRVQRYDFKRVSKDDIVENLKKIAKAEKIEIEDGALELIALSAQGGHRDAIVLLEKISSLDKKIDVSDVANILGIADRKIEFQFLGAIFNARPEEGLKIAHRLYEDGTDMVQFNKDILEILRKILVFKGAGAVLFEDSAENIDLIKDFSGRTETGKLIGLIETFIKSGNLLKDIAYPVLPIEMATIESCDSMVNSKFEIPNSKQIPNSNIQNTKTVISTDVEKSSNIKSLDGVYPELAERARDDNKKSNEPASQPANQPESHDTVPVAVFQMTSDIWDKLITAVKRENNSLAALLRDTKPLQYSDNKLVLGVKFKFHKDKISSPEHIQTIEKVFCDITGNKCVVSCRTVEVKPIRQPAETEGISGEELQKAAEEIFA